MPTRAGIDSDPDFDFDFEKVSGFPTWLSHPDWESLPQRAQGTRWRFRSGDGGGWGQCFALYPFELIKAVAGITLTQRQASLF
ncbi:MAG: hypothetical protein ACOX52_19740 [Verrucomicrobiota bacterium]